MASAPRLDEASREYLKSRKARGIAPGTLRNDQRTLHRLMVELGNIQVRSITEAHIDRFFTVLSQSRGLDFSTMNIYLANLRPFFRWARARGMTPRDYDPVAERRSYRVTPKSRQRVPVAEFPVLLDACEHPRDRIIVALGLYLFLRSGEISTLRWRDVNLETGEVSVAIHKTHQRDVMPICAELDEELRRWATWVTTHHGRIDPDWFLAPARMPGVSIKLPSGRQSFARPEVPLLSPSRQYTQGHRAVQAALAAIGFSLRTEGGASAREGVHTLRRSGARALYDQLSERGHDRAIQQVRVMLHHASGTMTERYLGVEVETKQRNDLIRGKRMYAALADNIVPLRKVAGGQDSGADL